VLSLLLLSILIGCSSLETVEEDKLLLGPPKSGLLAESEGTYSLFSIGRQVNYKELSEEGINTVNKFVYFIDSYESANEKHPILELEQEPAFVVFDTKGIVYKGYSFEELLEFLKSENDN
jgi:hypothetical protein